MQVIRLRTLARELRIQSPVVTMTNALDAKVEDLEAQLAELTRELEKLLAGSSWPRVVSRMTARGTSRARAVEVCLRMSQGAGLKEFERLMSGRRTRQPLSLTNRTPAPKRPIAMPTRREVAAEIARTRGISIGDAQLIADDLARRNRTAAKGGRR